MTGEKITAQKFLDFQFLTDFQDNLFTWNFFDYDFTQDTVSNEYLSPIFFDIENITPLWQEPWIDSSLPMVELDWSVSDYTPNVYCNSFDNASLMDYTAWSTDVYWIGWDPIDSQFEEWTWTQYDIIICQTTFNHDTFQSQQLYDVKMFVFFGFLLFALRFWVYILKTFIFSRDNV